METKNWLGIGLVGAALFALSKFGQRAENPQGARTGILLGTVPGGATGEDPFAGIGGTPGSSRNIWQDFATEDAFVRDVQGVLASQGIPLTPVNEASLRNEWERGEPQKGVAREGKVTSQDTFGTPAPQPITNGPRGSGPTGEATVYSGDTVPGENAQRGTVSLTIPPQDVETAQDIGAVGGAGWAGVTMQATGPQGYGQALPEVDSPLATSSSEQKAPLIIKDTPEQPVGVEAGADLQSGFDLGDGRSVVQDASSPTGYTVLGPGGPQPFDPNIFALQGGRSFGQPTSIIDGILPPSMLVTQPQERRFVEEKPTYHRMFQVDVARGLLE